MPTFKYKARDRAGKAVDGKLEAPTLQLAGDQLYRLGYLPISIEEAEEAALFNLSDLINRLQKVRLEDIVVFSQQLSTLYKAGLPLLTGLSNLKDQADNKKLQNVLDEVCRDVEGGNSLFASMAKHPHAFSPIYVNMVRAGETSGRLGESLDRFVALADRELSTRQRLKEATRYPKIVIFSVIVAFGVLLVFVIPRFAATFAQFNMPLPLPTRIMIGMNKIFQNYWYLVLGGLLGISIFVKRYIKTENGRYFWDKFKTRIPVLGPVFLKIGLSRFSNIFGMLNQSGIPILQALEITSTTVDNVLLSQSIESVQQKVEEGSSLTNALKESKRFTPLVIQMISVGESSGTLDEMLKRVTDYYDVEVDNALKKLPTYIEPALTLFLGGVVLLLALAVFLPWWNMASLFR
ncbi:MAG: type II secretion system F family protein [Deltaproteobacteria bacterium]|nr:type II secretion system F family protein [Deltaproteobacteria bacterium]